MGNLKDIVHFKIEIVNIKLNFQFCMKQGIYFHKNTPPHHAITSFSADQTLKSLRKLKVVQISDH